MKRFYEKVEVGIEGEGYQIHLDGRPVRSPAKRPLVLPNEPLAQAVAQEWRGQDETIEQATMVLTRLASTALDRMPELRAAAIDEVAGYALTDLVCYQAADPPTLAERQRQHWQPWLAWLEERYGVALVVTTAVLPVTQPEEGVERLRTVIEQLDDWRLVGLHAATTTLGSVVLGLALLEGEIDAEQAFAASLLDELYEIERWGVEREAQRRHEALRHDLKAIDRFTGCLRSAARD